MLRKGHGTDLRSFTHLGIQHWVLSEYCGCYLKNITPPIFYKIMAILQPLNMHINFLLFLLKKLEFKLEKDKRFPFFNSK